MKILRYLLMTIGLAGTILLLPGQFNWFMFVWLPFVLLFIGSFWIGAPKAPEEPPASQ